jgi:hypothetical protein
MAADPWSAFLEWLTTVLVPNWGELIALLPYVVMATLVGPIITLLVLMWGWHLITRRRGRISRAEARPTAAQLLADGRAAFPPNTPYCEEHGLLYPARVRRCEIDGADLSVTCPVDGSVRVAEIETCAACGTRYTLGASSGRLVVVAADGPPDGGAAAA